jgi:hypothetical protein
MKHGAFNVILKANDKVCNRNSQHPHNLWKFTCWNHKWRQCSLPSSVSIPIHFEFISQSQTVNQAYYVEILKWLHEVVCRIRPELWHNNWILKVTMLQLTRCCLAVSGQKINYWNGTLTLFLWFGSKWPVAVYKNKVCLKGMKISGYWTHPKKMWWHWKLFHNRVPKMFPTVVASLG